jgi:membrane protease YdiL (CAAX protease family)
MISSSLVFGLLHLAGFGLQDVWVVVLLACYGVIFATLTVVNRGRIGASIVAHMLNNAMVFLVVLA